MIGMAACGVIAHGKERNARQGLGYKKQVPLREGHPDRIGYRDIFSSWAFG